MITLVVNGRVPRTKTPAQLIAELDALARRGWKDMVFIVDDNFIGNKPRTKTLLRTLVELEGTAQQLSPEFSLAEVFRPFYGTMARRRLSVRRILGRGVALRFQRVRASVLPHERCALLAAHRLARQTHHWLHARRARAVCARRKGANERLASPFFSKARMLTQATKQVGSMKKR